MKNLKIRTKLMISFGSCGILLLLIAGIAFYALFMANARIDRMYNDNLKVTESLFSMQRSFQEQQSSLRNLILCGIDSPNYQVSSLSIQKSNTAMLETFAAFDKTTKTPKTSDLYDKIKTIYSKYFADVKNLVLQKTMDGDNKGAYNALISSGSVSTDFTDQLDQLIAINDKEGETRMSDSNRALILMYALGIPIIVGTIAWMIFLVTYINKLVAKPIREIADTAREISLGASDLTVAVTSKDEIGELSEAFNLMLGGRREQVRVVSALAKGDLTVECIPRSEKDTIALALQTTLTSLNEMFDEIRLAASQVSNGSTQVSSAAQSLSQGATEQASAIEQLSASIVDISDQVNDNAKSAKRASKLVVETGDEVERGNERMAAMLVAMEEISSSSSEIGKIIKVIDDIAFQTNILALNASVEAARAGAAGKGFAIVANEVRNLASKSAEAARQTAMLIEDSVSNVENGVAIAKDTAGSLTLIADKTKGCIKFMEDITAASNEQAVAVSQITTGVEQISSVVQHNSATAEESAAASEELSGQAELLQQLLGKFQLK